MVIFLFSKRKILTVGMLLILVAFSFTLIKGLASKKLATSVQGKVINPTILIDPGHGGRDPGATVEGALEKDINLDVALRLEKYLKEQGYQVYMTRTSDTSLVNKKEEGSYQRASLWERVRISKKNNPTLLISIHCNSSDNISYYGPQTFYLKGDIQGEKIATSIQNELVKIRPTKRQAISGEYFLLENTNCTTVIVEMGYLSNKKDRELLKTPQFRQKVAQAIARGIIAN